jgi:NADH:ubiquinone reductase (H+-translocating)
VTHIDADGAVVGNERLESRTVIWAAGVTASPAAHWLGAQCDRSGRVIVGPDLTVPGHPEVFVIGDTALAVDAGGAPLPGVAPVAKQQGAYVAKLIRARIASRDYPPFRYRNFGSLATIGRKSAVVEFGRVTLSGYLAWWLWGLAHIYFLIGFRNRIAVAITWMWSYLTFQRGTRLITGSDPEPAPSPVEPARPALRGAA